MTVCNLGAPQRVPKNCKLLFLNPTRIHDCPSALAWRAAGPVVIIRRPVDKALPKFTGRAPTILFIADDCFVNLGEWGWGPPQMALLQNSIAYGPGLFHRPEYATIGAVCLFWIKAPFGQDGIEYNTICAVNPNAMPSAKIPAHLYEALHEKPRYNAEPYDE